VHGNVTREHAESFSAILETGLASKPLAAGLRFKKSRMAVPPTGKTLVVQEIVRNPENLNSAIEYFIHLGDLQDMALRTRTSLLLEMIKEPCFDILRTKEQLGYLVWSMGRFRVGICGILLGFN
jgi:insulysin